MVKLNCSIRASTLIESIVAMVIITLAMAGAMLISSNIIRTNNPLLKFKAYTTSQQVVNNCLDSSSFYDDSWDEEGLTIERSIQHYRQYTNIGELHVRIFSNHGRLLIEKETLIKLP